MKEGEGGVRAPTAPSMPFAFPGSPCNNISHAALSFTINLDAEPNFQIKKARTKGAAALRLEGSQHGAPLRHFFF